MPKKIETFVLIRARHSCCNDIAHAFFLKDYKEPYKFSDMILGGIKKDIELGHTFEEYRYMVGTETNTILKTEQIPANKSKAVKQAIKQANEYSSSDADKKAQQKVKK